MHDLCPFDLGSHLTLTNIFLQAHYGDAQGVFICRDKELIYVGPEIGGGYTSPILKSYGDGNWAACNGYGINCARAWPNPSPIAQDGIFARGLCTVTNGSGLVFRGSGEVFGDNYLSIGLCRTGRHQPELRVNSSELLRCVFVRILQRPVEDNVGGTSEDNSEYKQEDSSYFTTGALVVIALLLSS